MNADASKEDIAALLEKKMGLDPTTYQIGKTKVCHLAPVSFIISMHLDKHYLLFCHYFLLCM